MNKNDCEDIIKNIINNEIKYIFIDWDNTFQIYNGMFKFSKLNP